MRIVSLLPSATEMVCLLGLRDQLVGISHECDYPSGLQSVPKVTRSLIDANLNSQEIDSTVARHAVSLKSLFDLDSKMLADLKPDLVITQRICDVCAVSESDVARALAALPTKPIVIQLEPYSLESALRGVEIVAEAAGVAERGRAKHSELLERLSRLRAASLAKLESANRGRPKVVLLEWLDPLFSAGHWNPEIIEAAGGQELIGHAKERSRRINWRDLQNANPDVLLIACCGYSADRAQEDLKGLQSQPGFDDLRCVRQRSVHFLDGSAYFNRPGPRLVDSAELVQRLLFNEEWNDVSA